tara:strand:+ start:1874 stop:3169 length:1296 start_codon:yes stop_codon:yes gene_type:complete
MLQSLRRTLGPTLLLTACPPLVMLMWYTNTTLAGSLPKLIALIQNQGLFATLYTIWRPLCFGSATAWTIIATFVLIQFILLKYLPGEIFQGPITPKGNIPNYRANGFLAFSATIFLFCLSTFTLHLFSPTLIYDNLGAIFGALNIASLLVCVLLYLKGRFAPSSTDASTTGNPIFDYYWGTELHPEMLGINIKQFINCRIGMMSWGLLLIAYAAKQQSLYGLSNSMLVSVGLQLLYIAKFFLWETGYFRSLDIMHDRAGFYICWGCLVWVPCIYTSASMYLVLHPIHLNPFVAATITMVGSASIIINYIADKQRQTVRATDGKCLIWGKAPTLTLASYTTLLGDKKENILLASGWWGIARHFHYIPEIIGALCWTLPALFFNVTPYFYVIFLTILLVDRSFRDDARCAEKYGDDWQAYCELVPYKMIPFII